MTESIYINPEDKHIWEKGYKVWLDAYTAFYVYAECAQHAVDQVVDYCEERGWHGLFVDDDIESYHPDDIIYAGNHCHALVAYETHIERIKS